MNITQDQLDVKFNIGDEVYLYRDAEKIFKIDQCPFIVVGIRQHEIECVGDWSGGVSPINQTGWINKLYVSKK